MSYLFPATEKVKLDYLETHSDDLEIVKEYWTDTHKCRRDILLIEKKSVDDYMGMFKPLREQIACDLVCELT